MSKIDPDDDFEAFLDQTPEPDNPLAVIDYSASNNQLSHASLEEVMERHISYELAQEANGSGRVNPNDSDTVQAHRILDYIGIETIEASITDGVSPTKIAQRLMITKGQFFSWVNSDIDYEKRYHKAQQAQLLSDAIHIKKAILKAGEMSKDEVRSRRLQFDVSKHVEDGTRETRQKDLDSGVHVTVDFGSLLG